MCIRDSYNISDIILLEIFIGLFPDAVPGYVRLDITFQILNLSLIHI